MPLVGAALTYLVCGAFALPFAFRREARAWQVWSLAIPCAVAWFTAMCCLYASFAAIGVVFGNIVQATRGLMSVGLGWAMAHIGHTHSYCGTLRGLLLHGLATDDKKYVDAVASTYRNGLWGKAISHSGWTPHDQGKPRFHGPEGDPVGEHASCGDVAQIALWLALRAGQTDLLDDVERMIRARLLTQWRAALAVAKDPVNAWTLIVENNDARSQWVKQRGLGGFVRSTWDEVNQLIAAANQDRSVTPPGSWPRPPRNTPASPASATPCRRRSRS